MFSEIFYQAWEHFLENGSPYQIPRMRSRSLMRVLALALDLSDIMYL